MGADEHRRRLFDEMVRLDREIRENIVEPPKWIEIDISAEDRALLTDDEWEQANRGELDAISLLVERGAAAGAVLRAFMRARKRD